MPEADVRRAAGAGAWNGGPEEAKGAWLFPDPLIHHRLRADPGDLWMIEVDGGSLEPLPSSDDGILIDTSRTVPAPPEIFVIRDGTALVAKRIGHVPHSGPPHVVPEPVNPRGRQLRVLHRGDPRSRTGGLGCREAAGRGTGRRGPEGITPRGCHNLYCHSVSEMQPPMTSPRDGELQVTDTITITVDPDLADAYRAASGQDRRKLDLLLNLRLRDVTRTGESLHEFMAEITRNARGRGLTPEILEELLTD